MEALTSIYGDDWSIESEHTHSYSIKIKSGKMEVVLSVTMPPNYPSEAPPTYEISSPSMQRNIKEDLYKALDEVYL